MAQNCVLGKEKGLPSDGFCGKKAFFIIIRAETFGFGL
jgi:hypothetical protein